MDIEHLRQFVQIVDIGSIQGAARQLGVSRSVLRRGLDALEAVVGAPLLHRDPTGVRLTATGAVTLERARPLLESAQVLVTEARAAERDAWGVIRVIEPVGMPLAVQVNALLAAHVALPNQRIVIRHTENPLADLSRPFELMLHEGPAPDRNAWFSRVIVRLKLRLLASRDYLARRGTPESVADLAGHDALGWNRPGHPAGEWPLFAGGALTVTPWFSSSDPQLLMSLAKRGGGILLAPHALFLEAPDVGDIQSVLEDQVGAELVFRVTTPFPARADARTRDTLQLILTQLEGLPLD
jgi:DNA-binding transcriptional LysR family regulator